MSEFKDRESSTDVDAEPAAETYAGKNAHAETDIDACELYPQAPNPSPIPPTTKPRQISSPSALSAPLETREPGSSPHSRIADDTLKIQDPSLRTPQQPNPQPPAADANASTLPSAECDTAMGNDTASATLPNADKGVEAATEAEVAFARARERKIVCFRILVFSFPLASPLLSPVSIVGAITSCR